VVEHSDIAHYLLSLGIVKPRCALEEDFTIVDSSRRHRVFVATTRSGPTLVVKQASPADGPALAHEATILRRLADAAEVAPHVPVVVHEEPGGACLVLRTPGGARDWSDRQGRFPRLPARALGRMLAAVHRVPVDLPAGPDAAWALLLPEPPYAMVRDLSAGAQEVVGLIQESALTCERLHELRESASDGALVHGDLRWENCLLLPPPGARRRTRVLLIDWEYAAQADPAIDLGSVIAEYLRVWVGSVPLVGNDEPDRFAAFARHPFRRMRPAVHDFWRAYRDASRHPPALLRVVEMAGVRLFQTAVERAQTQSVPSGHVITLLQLADNLLLRPDLAARHLLELEA
jgi:aminoglycoside phosphotransferase (APT) family kinase protein